MQFHLKGLTRCWLQETVLMVGCHACRMWSVWMFTIPSLRARECTPQEKDWLNYAFLVVPLVNVTLPLVWKSFAAVYTADCITLAALFYWKVLNAAPESAASDGTLSLNSEEQ
jgi:hypothetical protein